MPRPKGAHNKHKKEKPIKEKKKRGRPSKGSQHQKQKQHQVVNVTINSDGGGGNDKKKKNQFQQAIQSIPNMIFNPSLSIPQGAPINRPETNPPYYDMSSLIQSIQQPNPRIPVNPQPTQPIPVNPQPTQTIPVNPVDVQPTQPQPTQPIPYYPTPQPIKPKPKPNKPVPIQDNQPLNVEPYPYNDVLGSNLINLASSIALGAVTGGASVAAEAGIAGAAGGFAASGLRGAASGALTGVRSSIPTMARAAAGGGVATGISNIVGAGPVGNIIAGVAGGLASRGSSGIVGGAVSGAMNNVSNRVSGTRTRPRTRGRQPNNLETHPLLPSNTFEGRGNRTGGNSPISRLVDAESEIQLLHDPSTGESTQWILPNQQTNSIMSNIRNVANTTMTRASETISNLSNQINSRVRGRNRRGDYTSLPNSDSPYDREEVHPVSMESVQQRLRIHRATVKENEKREAVNEILDNLIDKSVQQSDTKKAASRIQAAIKRNYLRRK